MGKIPAIAHAHQLKFGNKLILSISTELCHKKYHVTVGLQNRPQVSEEVA